jgi:hypothetical protein
VCGDDGGCVVFWLVLWSEVMIEKSKQNGKTVFRREHTAEGANF